ncbi:MAG: serine--tRNA ligase [Vampirovibrionia bacterium]
MLDIKLIRENPEKINDLLQRRNPDLNINEIIDIDEQRRSVQTKADDLRRERKEISGRIGQMIKEGQDTTEIQAQTRKLGDSIKELEEEERRLNELQSNVLLNIPNTPQESVPIGTDETFNKEVRKFGEPRKFDFEPKNHWDIGVDLDILDFERGVKISESRFLIYKGAAARLERALINFFLNNNAKDGFVEHIPPFLVNSTTMTGTGQLPKFAEDMYKCENENLYLIPTAEVPLTNIYSNEILKESDLPVYSTAYTPCFRREAGSAGKDTRGLIRLHQFNKVEIVKLCTPETSKDEHETLTQSAEKLLQLLELPYRVIELCTGDIGFGASKCYDLEVWMPGSNTYREISSCSNFTDFQARRANIKYRPNDTEKPVFVHTLNGSALAVGRTTAAILENFQQADGSVNIPKALWPYLGDERSITK